MAWVPAASASAGQASRPAHAREVASTARGLLDAVRQRAVSLPPTVSVGNGPDGLAFDPATHTLYTSNQNTNSVSVLNGATCTAADTRGCRQRVRSVSLPAGASPQGIALNAATGTIYVANIGGNSISVINARTCNAVDFSGCRKTPASIKDPGGPIALAVDQATDTVYVANIGDNFSGQSHTLSVINGATCNGHQHSGCGQTPPTARVGRGPDGVAVDQATDTVYVVNNGPANNGDTVSVINGATCNGARHSGCGQTAASVRVGHGPFWIAVDQAAHTAYTANNTDSTVSVINTAFCNGRRHSGCGQRTSAVPVGFRPWALTIDQALQTVFVINNQDDTMSAINSLTCDAAHRAGCGHRPATSQVGKGPQAVITDPATGTLYAANFTDNTVSVINPARCNAARTGGCRHPAPTAEVGAGPDGLAVDRATSTVYVANSGNDTVSVINTATCNARRGTGCARPAATIHAGPGPAGIAVDQATGTIYVADAGGNTVSVINAATCNARRHTGCGQTPATVTVGTSPFGIAVDQATDSVYVTSLGANDLGDTVSVIRRRHLRRRPPLRLRADRPDGQGRHRAVRHRRQPGHRHHLRGQHRPTVRRRLRSHRLCDQRRHLQRRAAHWLRANTGNRHRRSRPVRHRRQPGHRHYLRGQQQRRRRPRQPVGHKRRYLRRRQHHRMRQDPARHSRRRPRPQRHRLRPDHAHRLYGQLPGRDRVRRQRHPRSHRRPLHVATKSRRRQHARSCRCRYREPHHLRCQRLRWHRLHPARAAGPCATNRWISNSRSRIRPRSHVPPRAA